jgi:3-oxoacyl-[acyl-carrier-protein] synthase-3
VGPVILRSDARGADLIRLERGGRISMRGPETFRAAVRALAEITAETLEASGWTRDEIDLYVYHQANGRNLTAVGERLGLDRAKVVDCIAHLGNTTAATLPLALDYAQRDGRLRSGAKVLLGAFGAGFTWGATVMTWNPPAGQ